MKTTYKILTFKDIDVVVAMMVAFYAIDHYPIDPVAAKRLLEEFTANKNLGKAWLIVTDKEIVGYVLLTFVFSFEYGGTVAFIDELYLSEGARGKGIGKQTLDFLKSESDLLRLKLLYLEVESHNKKAENLYLSAGFEMHHRRLMRYKIPASNNQQHNEH